jgi:uncharacterized flavoprotein (TIGR03862 family)
MLPVVIVGGGPAGLMAAEQLSAAGLPVHLFDAMPTVGRKFLLAGIGGLNLTHAEPLHRFQQRYGVAEPVCARWLQALSPQGVRDWAAGLGIETLVGSSQRVFPTDMKAAPLLRAWLQRLRHPVAGAPVAFHTRHRWDGTLERVDGVGYRLAFTTPHGFQTVQTPLVLLALGGGSWPTLGSDGAWLPWLARRGVPLQALRPANCGFDVAIGPDRGWSAVLASRHAGQPLKGVTLTFTDAQGEGFTQKGECVLTATGIEGSLVYAASARLRDTIAAQGQVTVMLNLKPDWTRERLLLALEAPWKGKTLTQILKGRVGLPPVAVALLQELLHRPPNKASAPTTRPSAERLADWVQALPVTLAAPRPLEEAISTAGGVALDGLTDDLMLKTLPGVFCAGEMLDWEAPTGGYLLTACLASGRVAGQGMVDYAHRRRVAVGE